MATSTQAALQQIQDYANRNTGVMPTLSTYADAGVKDANGKPLVTSMNLAAINSALASTAVTSAQLSSITAITTL